MSPIIANEANVGIAVRTIKEFYKQKLKIKDELRDRFTFYVSFFQIYNEMVFDLLNFDYTLATDPATGGRKFLSKQRELKVRYNNRDQFVVENLFLYECATAQEAITLYNQGIKNKIISSHKMNHASSRSHCIFSIQVEQLSEEGQKEAERLGMAVQPIASSKMFLVDLAGSEKISLIGDLDKNTQRETIQINKSLMVLRKCIAALANDQTTVSKHIHVPYRECKLTSILK